MVRFVLFFSAIFAFVLSAIVHTLASFGVSTPPETMMIHGLIFVFFLPGLYYLFSDLKEAKSINPKLSLAHILDSSPKYLLALTFILQIYTLGNFFIRLGSLGNAQPHYDGKTYYVSGRDTQTRVISEEEYYSMKASLESAFSSHWMLFLSASMLLLYPFRNLNKLKIEKKLGEIYNHSLFVQNDPRFGQSESGLIFNIDPLMFWIRLFRDRFFLFFSVGVFILYILSYFYPQILILPIIGTYSMMMSIIDYRFFLFKVLVLGDKIQLEFIDFFEKEVSLLPASSLRMSFSERVVKGHFYYELLFYENGKKLLKIDTDNYPYNYEILRTLYENLKFYIPDSFIEEINSPHINTRNWYDSVAIIVLLLFFFFPLGVYAAIKTKALTKSQKWLLIGIPGALIILVYSTLIYIAYLL